MSSPGTVNLVCTLAILLLLTSQAHAFGAGNIASVAKIEGLNWRHGDIEDTLLTLLMARVAGGKKFDKLSVARVYFGNWLRDYSQAIDVGTVKYVSAEAIRILLWVLGFMTFGYGTGEFEVTADRLGCYRPEDHIDNPLNYADNLDARQYDRRLRGPVNERLELAIDPRTGMKNYIANEPAGCMTSAQHVRRLFGESIRLGRSYARSRNKKELYEALRLLGTGLHCLEDFSAHSNYTELALIEMGERDVFPHVGRRTQLQLPGAQHAVFPLITGTFGGVDFLHSVMGEFSDKATQSEIQELQGTMQESRSHDNSMLKDLLNSVPSGLFGGKDEAGKADELQTNATAAQMSQMRVSPREPEAFTRQMQDLSRQIYPIIEWHDELMKSITESIEKIPILPDLIEKIEGELNVYVFSLLAPFVLPIIDQIKTELNTGSSEVIQSSKDQQLIVFHNDNCSDPTHSMLSKDHFSNILNEPAGKIASAVLKWAVPQLMACWDDERSDPQRTIDRIIHGVFHHPAQRSQAPDGAADGRMIMFNVVEQWWRNMDRNEQNEYRRKLSREGVLNGENHKEGVQDTGHGCGKPLGMHKNASSTAPGLGGGIAAAAGASGLLSSVSEVMGGGNSGGGGSSRVDQDSFGGTALGGLVGALSGVGGGLLSGLGNSSRDDDDDDAAGRTFKNEGYTSGGGYTQQETHIQHQGNRYQQTQYEQTSYPGGARTEETRRYEQDGRGGYGYDERVDERPMRGGYERTQERRYESEGGENWRERNSEFIEAPRENLGGYAGNRGREEYEAPRQSQQYGGGYSSGRDEYGGGRGREYVQERERYEEPQRESRGGGEYGGGYGSQEYDGGRQEYGGGQQQYGSDSYDGARGGYGERERERGNEWGEERREERREEEEEYREEQREESGGGWFS